MVLWLKACFIFGHVKSRCWDLLLFFLKLADLNSSNKIGADADGCLKWQPCFRQNGRVSRRCSELEHPNLSSRIWELCLFLTFSAFITNHYRWLRCLWTFGEVDIFLLSMCLCKQISADAQQGFGARISFGEGWIMIFTDFPKKRFGGMDLKGWKPAICFTWDFFLLF